VRAVRVVAPGSIEITDVPEPDPGNSVLVRVGQVGICGTDTKILAGKIPVEYPRIMGHEMVGEVVTAPEGSPFPTGTRVLVDPGVACGWCHLCHAGRFNICINGGLLGRDMDGVFTEYIVVPLNRLVAVLPSISDKASGVLQVLGTRDPRVYVYDYSVPGKAQRYLHPSPGQPLARQPEGWTLDAAGALAWQMYLAPETAGRWGLRGSYEIDYRGLYPAKLEFLTRLLRKVEGTSLHLRFLRMANVTHVVAFHRDGFENLKPLGEIPGLFAEPIRVFGVMDALPRAYAVGAARVEDRLDGLGGAIVAWADTRNGNKDIFAHKLGLDGPVPTRPSLVSAEARFCGA